MPYHHTLSLKAQSQKMAAAASTAGNARKAQRINHSKLIQLTASKAGQIPSPKNMCATDDRVYKVDVVALPADRLYRLYVTLTVVAVVIGAITVLILLWQMKANEHPQAVLAAPWSGQVQ